MHLKTLGAVSALALFAGVSAGAFAQAPGGGQSQGAQQRMETPDQSSPGQQQTSPGQQKGQSQAEEPSQKGKQAQEPGMRKGQQAEEPGQRKGQQAQEPGQRKGQQAQEPGQRKGQQAEEGQTKQQKQRAEQPEGKQQKQRAEQPEGKQQKQRAEQPQGKQQRQQAEEPTKGKEQQQAGREGGRVQLSEQQRTTVRERFRESGALDRARVSNVNFNISVGTRVPRDRVQLATLPSVIVEEVPAYRGYRYFVVRDEIVIVNPQTYVIVDVIRADGATGRTATRGSATQTRLSLSPEQRRVVISHINRQEPGIRLGIGDVSIGMAVPQQVELHSFPATVVQEVPELRSYRYFVFENEVAIVSPQDRHVVLTINE